MPNNNSVTLYFPSDARKLVKKYLSKKTDEGVILDFEKIIPMPKALAIVDQSIDLKTEKGRELQSEYTANKALWGFATWYDWRIINWGTKWNSYSVEFDGDTIRLQTAYTPPIPVIEKLAKLIKKNIRMTYRDEFFNFWGETFFYANGDAPLNNCYKEKKETPEELDKELGISGSFIEFRCRR